ncbi:uncharacterized protein ACLA_088730 [Aspergillus clavatus NRRL 1]|uniref:Ima1 N-terminal domain-containing protein n=1 Tax=Aspergillus clavatus (strain ATCC 1007 / CBS 513.65 / DSM 816 / NCTC 3887 / NRRL 1 / QM 1276 / 107) TaxID=344612 RepID=A1CE85_ASPCL|nr:uncharacterized protein ACLA_088730 [Aspergillus clavatus NRRL 1]EAW11184.1 conserved hypothetical protein [Aspergillus clavatus NRRL 1]
MFSKRLSCFYCGRRSAQAGRDVRKWQCKHCEAVNHLDEKGEITDPPAAETNPDVYGPGAMNVPLESVDLTGSGLFCAQCVRNQHLFTSALASYFPPPDDPEYNAYEREYPTFRRNLEERYPQVCAKCEPRVKERIRQAGYEAKSDHLRRMMDRSKAGRAARQARQWNWRNLLVSAGAISYWSSVVGQLAWNTMGALHVEPSIRAFDNDLRTSSVASCFWTTLQVRQLPGSCWIDLSPYAGLALVAGILSLWWNPKLRLKVEGRGGRFVGLGEYYQVQLIVMVVRCVFWAMLKDPASSGLQDTLPLTLHFFMIFFTILSVVISRRVVKYDTRPLVAWSDNTPTATPNKKALVSPDQSSVTTQRFTPLGSDRQATPRFPLEKLAAPRLAPEKEPAIPPTPPPEVDDMDWTPSVQHEIKPTMSVYQKDTKSVLDGPLPFYGSLPAAPKPPSWALRTQTSRPKPIQQVVERNPFHRTPTQSPTFWQRNTASRSESVFAPPKFFPMSDHISSTGLESLFDRAFTIKSPEDENNENWQQQQQQGPGTQTRYSADMQAFLLFQYLRLGLLLSSIAAWFLSQYNYLSIPGNYIEVASLGSASLIAGFALLDVLKQPIVQWNGMEILIYFAELVAAVHLGGNLPHVSFERHYFDRYGKLLLVFMTVQEALGLLSLFQIASASVPNSQAQQPNQTGSPSRQTSGSSPLESNVTPRLANQSFNSEPPVPPLSFSMTAAGSSFTIPSPEPQYQLGFSNYNQVPNQNHSFTLNSLKGNESDVSDAFDRDSDTETTVTTATTATSNTVRNIRYGRNPTDAFFSPRRSELGPGIGGLSLEDKPNRRVTRSQTQRLTGNEGLRKYTMRGLK